MIYCEYPYNESHRLIWIMECASKHLFISIELNVNGWNVNTRNSINYFILWHFFNGPNWIVGFYEKLRNCSWRKKKSPSNRVGTSDNSRFDWHLIWVIIFNLTVKKKAGRRNRDESRYYSRISANHNGLNHRQRNCNIVPKKKNKQFFSLDSCQFFSTTIRILIDFSLTCHTK